MAIHLLRQVALSWLPANPKLPLCLRYLAITHLTRFTFTGKAEDVYYATAYRRTESNVRTRFSFSTKAKDFYHAAICCRRRKESYPDDDLRVLLMSLGIDEFDIDDDATSAMRSASDILTQFHQSVNLTRLDRAVSLHREVLLSKPKHWKSLCDLSEALRIRFRIIGTPGDLEETILLLRQIHSIRPNRSVCLCAGLLTREFLEEGQMLEIANLALTALGSDKEALNTWSSGYSMMLDIKTTGNLSRLDTALLLLQKAESQLSWGHEHRIDAINVFAAALLQRFKHRGDTGDLDHCIELCHEALVLHPDLVPVDSRAISLNNLGIAYRARMIQTSNMSYLNKAIDLQTEALSLRPDQHPEHADALSNLAVAIRERYMRYGDIADLNRAIDLQRKALALPPDSMLDRGLAFSNLAISLFDLFKQKGDMKDLDCSIELHEKGLALRPTPHRERSGSLEGLANGFRERFNIKGAVTDLDKAITYYREGLSLRPATHPDRACSLITIACSLQARFVERGNSVDLDSAIDLFRESLSLWSGSNANRFGSLNNLAGALLLRSERKGDFKSLDEALSLYTQALDQLPPLHPDRGNILSNMGLTLCTRFRSTHNTRDLEDGIRYHREALELHTDLHRHRGVALYLLANGLLQRFIKMGDETDFESAVQIYHEALALCTAPNPDRHGPLSGLASLLMAKYQRSPDPLLAEKAVDASREASMYSSVHHRFQTCKSWATYATRIQHSSALEAYSKAIELLPQAAVLDLDVSSRQKALTAIRSDGIASDAAACAIRVNELGKAIEFLEAGRSIFWQQALQLRTSLDDFHLAHPELGRRAADIMRKLERGSHRDLSSIHTLPADSLQHSSHDAESLRLRNLDAEWLDVLRDIRARPGFNNFLLPKSLAKLKAAAAHGPVVILNMSTVAESGSASALIVTASSDVQCIPLPDINIYSAAFLAGAIRALPISTFLLYQYLNNWKFEHSSTLQIRLTGRIVYEDMNPNQAFGLILEELWKAIVKPVLSALKLEKSSNPPRLWWCPTGVLTFLPIHAAGIYAEHDTDYVSQYVISSYSPTLAALLDPPAKTRSPFKMTAVIEPNAPNLMPLPDTEAELSRIEERIPNEWLTSIGRTERATMKLALVHLRTSAIMHFSCHGIQDLGNPLDSGLALADGRLKVSEIMRDTSLARSHSTNGMSLAFLSACETGKGDINAPDEAMHLAATLLFAGFSGVVATMWSIADSDGPKVADIFYEHLFKDCDATSQPPVLPDLKNAAEALHNAVAKLREDPNISFMRWVPFVHYGL
ncbi:CHAT domain-containing protein [Mycena epipterygia]|nr:CHAT domain-containing protein [Mycena epipterygia]